MKSAKKSVYDGYPEVKSLFSELSAQLDKEPFFEFWKLIEKAELISKSLKKGKVSGIVESNVVMDGLLIVGEGSVVKAGTRIEGVIFIGENCKIGPNAYLRGNSFIQDNCHIANSEIKNSIILSNSNVPHYSYVGDSILGQSVNLGAGTKIANLRFDNGLVKVELHGEKVDSRRRKLGSLIGHNTKTGINSSINCGLIVGNNCFIHPGRVLEKNLASGEVCK